MIPKFNQPTQNKEDHSMAEEAFKSRRCRPMIGTVPALKEE